MLDEESKIFDLFPQSKLLTFKFYYFQVCDSLNLFSCPYFFYFHFVDFEVDIEGKRFMWQVISLKLCSTDTLD
jgi:hypothetical protein